MPKHILICILGGWLLAMPICSWGQRLQKSDQLYALFTRYGDELNCKFINFIAERKFDGQGGFSCSDCVFNHPTEPRKDYYRRFVKISNSRQDGLAEIALGADRKKAAMRKGLTPGNWGNRLLSVANHCLILFPSTYLGRSNPGKTIELKRKFQNVLNRAYQDWKQLYPEAVVPVEFLLWFSEEYETAQKLLQDAKTSEAYAQTVLQRIQVEAATSATYTDYTEEQATAKEAELDQYKKDWEEAIIMLSATEKAIKQAAENASTPVKLNIEQVGQKVAEIKRELQASADFDVHYQYAVESLPKPTQVPWLWMIGVIVVFVIILGLGIFSKKRGGSSRNATTVRSPTFDSQRYEVKPSALPSNEHIDPSLVHPKKPNPELEDAVDYSQKPASKVKDPEFPEEQPVEIQNQPNPLSRPEAPHEPAPPNKVEPIVEASIHAEPTPQSPETEQIKPMGEFLGYLPLQTHQGKPRFPMQQLSETLKDTSIFELRSIPDQEDRRWFSVVDHPRVHGKLLYPSPSFSPGIFDVVKQERSSVKLTVIKPGTLIRQKEGWRVLEKIKVELTA